MDALGRAFAHAKREPGQALIIIGLWLALAATPAVFDPRLYDDFTLAKQAVMFASAALVATGLALTGEWLPRSRLLRISVGVWVGWFTVSWAFGIDPRGGLLGVYQYRQGYLTNLCYVVLLLGGVQAGRTAGLRAVLPPVVLGLTAVTGYTAIQSAGLDPVDWWLDTSVRAIGTIGNANELAAYALIALACAGVVTRGRGVLGRYGSPVAVAAAVSFVVLEAESRSGIAALVLAAALLPVGALLTGMARRELVTRGVLLPAGFALGLLFSVAAGGFAGTSGRLDDVLEDREQSGSTRLALIQGTLPSIAASPAWGHGPDGLYLAFPRNRPELLGGVYETHDLVAQSSHNWLLDTAANTGLVGLGALLVMLGAVAFRSVQAERATGGENLAYVWAAMLAYCALTLLNPLSLAAHATFFALLGVLAGRAERGVAPRNAGLSIPARLAVAAPAAVAFGAMSLLLPLADLRADQGWQAYSSGDFGLAAERYGAAGDLVGISREYRIREANANLAAGVAGNRDAMEAAERLFLAFDDEFGLDADTAWALATARIGLGSEPERVLEAVDRGLRANPHGVGVERYAAVLRAAATGAARLTYVERDRRVMVELEDLTR